MNILIIEDDKQIAEYMHQELKELGHKLEVVNDGLLGLKTAKSGDFDVMVIDRMLPKLEGLAIIRSLREDGNSTPVLIISALDEVDERVRGLKNGSDDYLVKPFSFIELEARIEALYRRSKQTLKGLDVELQAGDIKINILDQTVTRAGKKVPMQQREFQLLRFFMEHKGQVVTRNMLLEMVWGYQFDPQTNVIDVHISRLRRKVDGGRNRQIIQTIRGSGYMISD